MTTAASPAVRSRAGRLTRALARSTAPLSRPLAGRSLFPLWGVVHHRGRRSGRAYATPVVIRATPDGFVVPMPWGDRTQWFHNLVEAGGGTVRWSGRDHAVMDLGIVGLDKAASAFHPAQRRIMRAAGITQVVRMAVRHEKS